MTGYAALGGELVTEAGSFSCQWDLRSVNGRGLDLRFRLPDWLDGLEPGLRKMLADRLARGNVTLALKLSRADQDAGPRLNVTALDAAVTLVLAAERRAESQGLGLAPMTAADLLALRGVIDTGPDMAEPAPLVAALLEHARGLIDAFEAARAAEGAALGQVIGVQVDTIARLTAQARAAAESRRGAQIESLTAALTRLSEAAPQADPGRLEQELALIAVKTDVTEELDRLDAHVTAARALLAEAAPIGRKLDFLMQEFNR
ncbi:MAG: DUF1732 domain-containing protein, partial [Rhodobacteraceae bacterium]|nr:DUF1732 domain-containing protein [Paracoccaceae bacterium]